MWACFMLDCGLISWTNFSYCAPWLNACKGVHTLFTGQREREREDERERGRERKREVGRERKSEKERERERCRICPELLFLFL